MSFEKPTQQEVEVAFSKLQASVYFDNYDLVLRKKVAEFKKNSVVQKAKKFVQEFDSEHPFADKLKKRINLLFLPKKIKSTNLENTNFYSNSRIVSENEISKPAIFCDFAIELHIIAAIWIMRYGAAIDSSVSKNSFGNRLIIDKESTSIIEGRSLFKPYFRQFQNWWSLAIKSAKELLAKEENVTIVNFDIQSFYHNVHFKFDEIELFLLKINPKINEDPIHKLLVEIHKEYKKQISKVCPHIENREEQDSYPLPIGLFTSQIFGNWYLKKLDKFIEKKLIPVYYGRYVDDILIVLKDTVYNNEDKEINELDGKAVIEKYLATHFSTLFKIMPGGLITIDGFKDLPLNMEKLFVYQFDAKYSPNLIDNFADDQKERASMFKFLSDEEDEYFEDFDAQTFESNFDHVDANKARFKNIEDNKYKLSVFFSKLIKRRVQKGAGYREFDIDKISKYFKGAYVIKHYFFGRNC